MPLTAFQKDVLAVLAANRSEESHFAGVLLHPSDDSPRFSRDFDIFHDVALAVVRASARDVASLGGAGFTVDTISRHGEWERDTTFRRALVRGAPGAPVELVEIDWAADSAFRFFPIERDPQLGWRLHLFDAATNKALTLAARTETRDYVDIVELAGRFPLAAICWAACGKDPGFTPLSLLKMMRRFARIDPAELDKIQARALDPIGLKTRWLSISDEAEVQMTTLADERPDIPIGVAFVDTSGRPSWIGGDPALRIHAPSVRGCWPQVRGLSLDWSGAAPAAQSDDARGHRCLRAETAPRQLPEAVSSDGKRIVLRDHLEDGSSVLSIAEVDRPNERRRLPWSAGSVSGVELSADDKWMAVETGASGRPEVVVYSFSDGAAPVRVSPRGGSDPQWSPSPRVAVTRCRDCRRAGGRPPRRDRAS